MMRMSLLLFALLSGVMINDTFAAPAGSYDPLRAPRLIEFRKKIGYESALAKEKKNEQVVVNWDNIPVPPELDGWTLNRGTSVDPEGTHHIRLDFARQAEQVYISVDVFDPKNNRAADNLLLKADAVTTMTITDIRGPEDLGTLSLMSSSKSVDLVYWVYRNALAEVSTYGTDVPALTIARWLQKQMEINTR